MESSESIFGKSPPPRPEDVLFRSAEAGTNACISYWHNVNYPYKKGFRVAARRLAMQVCETHLTSVPRSPILPELPADPGDGGNYDMGCHGGSRPKDADRVTPCRTPSP